MEKISTKYDEDYISLSVNEPDNVSHKRWQDYLYLIGNKKGFRILEIGSREVTGQSIAREKFNEAEYIGFDLLPGDNVDIVGDAHNLSSYFNESDKFDLIYSSACFEHFAMPWVVAKEISKVLKIGGYVFVETHFTFSSHGRPWHFFHFTDFGLRALFSKALGFECVEAGMSNSIVGRFSSLAADYLKNKPVKGLYCHSEFLGKKVRSVPDFEWEKVKIEDVYEGRGHPESENGSILNS